MREKPYDRAKRGEPGAAKPRANRVERRGGPAAFSAFQSLSFLALALMLFNQRGACEEDCRHRQKQSTHDGTPDVRRHASHNRRKSSQQKAQDELGPAALSDSGELETYDHLLPQQDLLEADGDREPCGGRRCCRRQRRAAQAHQELANEKTVNHERDRAENH